MTTSDPLIKELGDHLLRLQTDGVQAPINDTHPSLHTLCQCLESLFRRGLRSHQNTPVGIAKQDYWIWIYSLNDFTNTANTASYRATEKPLASFKSALDKTQKCSKVRTVQGRGRFFLRLALMTKIVAVPVQILVTKPELRQKNYDPHMSILGDESLTEVVLSALREIGNLNFDLNLKNSSFLDETWLLPIYKSYEFVPSKQLGIKIGYVRGRALAVLVGPGSVAAEDDKIEVGDILDELFGTSLYNCKRWTIPNLLKHNRGQPIPLDVIKGHFPSGELFPPAAAIMRQLGLNVEHVMNQHRKKEREKRLGPGSCNFDGNSHFRPQELDKNSEAPRSPHTGFKVHFMGSVYLGSDGCKDQITYGISEILKRHSHSPLRDDATRVNNVPRGEGTEGITTTPIGDTNTETEDKTEREVLLMTDETSVLVKDVATEKYFMDLMSNRIATEVLFKHSYTRIGACGRPTIPAVYFAYTIGETSCNLAQHFQCFVYKATNAELSKEILQNIAKGFERTRWAV